MKQFKEFFREILVKEEDTNSLEIVKQTKPSKMVVDYRKEWYVRDPKLDKRIARIPQYALVEFKILESSNDVKDLLSKQNKEFNKISKGVNPPSDVIFTALTLEEASNFNGTSMIQESISPIATYQK
jgi:hypothetical protein